MRKSQKKQVCGVLFVASVLGCTVTGRSSNDERETAGGADGHEHEEQDDASTGDGSSGGATGSSADEDVGDATGGDPSTADAGAESGGMAGSGGSGGQSDGTAGSGGRSDGTGGVAAAGGATVDDDCKTGETNGAQVLLIGDSFFAASAIAEELATLAVAQGSLPSGDSYLDKSVSGTTLVAGSNSIPSQYLAAVSAVHDISTVIMTGGGNDCLADDISAAVSAAKDLFGSIAENGTENVVYAFYPDPVGAAWSTYKSCLDSLREEMASLCATRMTPSCYFVDLRAAWNDHPQYTNDGIHPTREGSEATAEAIWEVMKDNCIAQ